MSTNANIIGFNLESNTWDVAYCHWDGYPAHVGATLNDHYSKPADISNLLQLGDISVLAKSIEDSTFFARDRDEDLNLNQFDSYNDAVEFALGPDSWCEYVYLHAGDHWEIYNSGNKEFTKLTKNIIKGNEI